MCELKLRQLCRFDPAAGTLIGQDRGFAT